jgi:ABC-type glutathione transport system ATPase component
MPDTTMIYVTHDQVEAMTLADRIVVLAGGGIAQVGSPLTLYEKPASTFVAQFIGSPAMNCDDPARPCPRPRHSGDGTNIAHFDPLELFALTGYSDPHGS